METKRVNISSTEEPLEISYFDSNISSDSGVVFLHGIQGSKNSFQRLIESDLPNLTRVVIPDLLGFGESTKPPPAAYDLSTQSSALIRFFDHIGLRQVVLVGHSLGGMLATQILALIPDAVAGLVSSEGNLKLQDCGESLKNYDLTFEDFLNSRYPTLKDRGITASPEAFYFTARSVVDVSRSETLYGILQNAKVPVIFIRGSKSHFVTDPTSQQVKCITLEGHTHFTLANSQELLDIVRSFLAQQCEDQR